MGTIHLEMGIDSTKWASFRIICVNQEKMLTLRRNFVTAGGTRLPVNVASIVNFKALKEKWT